MWDEEEVGDGVGHGSQGMRRKCKRDFRSKLRVDEFQEEDDKVVKASVPSN